MATKAGMCFFLNTGRTFTFKDVEVITDNETAITIGYVAMSDGLHKEVTFYKSHIAGISKWLLP